MHSENISDHDLFASLLEKRSAEVQTEAERAALDNISSFEGKHRMSSRTWTEAIS
jgi:hypothetical protein